ncbi:MAG: hypothetical protein IKY16_07030 [Bacteroidales bacterium]|nr:hypothetical protein [Bacteroidales bacterium]
MTRQEFIDNVTEWSELIDFCDDNGLDECEDVMSSDDMNDHIENNISDYVYDNGWRSVAETLCGIDTSYDYYLHDGGLDFTGLNDDDFTDYKERVLEIMDDDCLWDDEDEVELEDDILSELEDEDDEQEDTEEVEEESCSVNDLLFSCFEDMMTIGKQKEAEERAEEVLFDSFISAVNV